LAGKRPDTLVGHVRHSREKWLHFIAAIIGFFQNVWIENPVVCVMTDWLCSNDAPSRRRFLQSVLGGVALGGTAAPWLFGDQPASPAAGDLPKPTPQQLAWQDCELGMFLHFDISVYKPGWDWRSWKDMPRPDDYNPKKLDTDQWLETAKSMGAKYAVFVAKHCTGFLQWQSDAYPYGLKQSKWRGGKGDVVRDFVASCEKYGIKPGIYASATANGFWKVDDPGRVNRGKGGDPKRQTQYAKACERMLTELWSRYGKLFHIWFDGGVLSPAEGGPRMLPLLQKYQPDANVFQGPAATVRWVGNENGTASYPCWATVSKLNGSESGDPNGKIWQPGECDVPLPGHGWFWEPNQNTRITPLKELMDMYYRSVGHGCNLLLNATPNQDGLIPESNVKHYARFGEEIARRFSKPLATTSGQGETVELQLPRPTKVNHVVIMEDIARGQLVREYVVEGLRPDNQWKKLCEGVSIGHKRIQKFPDTEVATIRFRALKSVAEPCVRALSAYACFHA
jgi:alpha-L-fucosidase